MCVESLVQIKHSSVEVPFAWGFFPSSLSGSIFHCTSQLVPLLFPSSTYPCLPASGPWLMLFVLPGMPFLPPSLPPFQTLLLSLFSSNVVSCRKALLQRALCQHIRTQMTGAPEGGSSLPTVASSSFCLGYTQNTYFLPHPAVPKSAH